MQKNIKTKKKGVTLIELAVSMAILIIAMGAILSAFVSCLLLNETNNNLVIALNDAEYTLEEVKALPYSGISSYTPVQFIHLTNEVISFSPIDINSRRKEVTVTVSWNERSNRARQVSLVTYIAK